MNALTTFLLPCFIDVCRQLSNSNCRLTGPAGEQSDEAMVGQGVQLCTALPAICTMWRVGCATGLAVLLLAMGCAWWRRKDLGAQQPFAGPAALKARDSAAAGTDPGGTPLEHDTSLTPRCAEQHPSVSCSACLNLLNNQIMDRNILLSLQEGWCTAGTKQDSCLSGTIGGGCDVQGGFGAAGQFAGQCGRTVLQDSAA